MSPQACESFCPLWTLHVSCPFQKEGKTRFPPLLHSLRPTGINNSFGKLFSCYRKSCWKQNKKTRKKTKQRPDHQMSLGELLMRKAVGSGEPTLPWKAGPSCWSQEGSIPTVLLLGMGERQEEGRLGSSAVLYFSWGSSQMGLHRT